MMNNNKKIEPINSINRDLIKCAEGYLEEELNGNEIDTHYAYGEVYTQHKNL